VIKTRECERERERERERSALNRLGQLQHNLHIARNWLEAEVCWSSLLLVRESSEPD